LLSPFLPDTSKEIFRQLNTTETTYDSINSFGALNVNEKLNPAKPLFNRIDAEKLMEEIQKNNVAEEEKIELQPEISIDDFMKIELRAAKVISCEPVKKSDKLLCLQLDDGMGGRQVVSGIAQWYKPDDLVGKTVTIVANLKPVKLRGVMSNGMICCSEMPDGSVKVNFLDAEVPCGAKIR
jgi:methionyl-tRNA synthetase